MTDAAGPGGRRFSGLGRLSMVVRALGAPKQRPSSIWVGTILVVSWRC
jgi:hypothetical protein